MESQKPSKSISTSTPSFSIRYNAEEEEVEQLYEPSKLAEAHSDNSSPQTTPVAEKKTKEKSARRSGSFEDGADKEDKWRLFTEIKGRITKKVEEKLDDFKAERMIKDKMKKEKKEKLKTTNSLSDSEDRSEDTSLAQASTVSNASSSPEKTKSLTVPNNDESDLGDISGSEEGSTPERPSTPTYTDDLCLQRPRPAGYQSITDDKKERSKSKGYKFKFYNKKKIPETVDVEEGVEAMEETPAEIKPLPIPKKKYHITVHRFPWTAVAAIAVLLLAYFCQKPSFLSGILVGVVLSFVVALWSDHLYRWISVVDPETNFLHGNYNYENVPFLSDKVIKKDSTPPEHKYFKGWMNELPVDYNPQTYHISQTETVYVKLVGSVLRLCSPKGKIPKRAFWSEPKHTMKFTRERAFDIGHCEVQLLPENLTNKRKWSRKYPMVIYLLPSSHLGTRWAESKKNLISDSDHSRSSPVNEIYIGNKKRDNFKWKLENLLRKFGKEGSGFGSVPEDCFGDYELEPIDNDVFHSDLEMESLDKTPRDSPVPSMGSGEATNKKSPTGSPTHSKEMNPDDKEKSSRSSRSSPENSPKKLMPVQEDDPSLVGPVNSTPSLTINDADDEGEDEEEDEISDFVKVSPVTEKTQIILFARSAREKDLWYRRLVAATTYTIKSELGDDKHSKQREKRMEELRDYVEFMKSYGQFRCSYENDTGIVNYDHTNKERENYLWLNLFVARILYDAMRQDFWIGLIKSKIQKKLAVIRLPAFIEPISLAEIKFSGSVPAIEWTHNVSMNDDGIWTEVELSYQGTMTMTVETKLNAFTALAASSQLHNHRVVEKRPKTAYMDSSQEDSGETSTEELGERTAAAKTLAFIDKVGSSKFMQQLKETRLVKKGLEEISNTPILLNVRVNRLIGTLVLNIPPPPSDRLWYGFKPNVEIHMECKPIVGARNINVDYISNMIEKVMRSEFQKVIVMPNMDDLVIPIMSREMPF